MATLAALLKHRGYEVSGSDEHVYPPMSDFLAAEGIPVLEGYRAGTCQRGESISSWSAMPSRVATPELEAVLDRNMRYRSLPEVIRDHGCGTRVDRDRRHAWQDHDDRAGRMAADARRASIRWCWSAASRGTSAPTARATGWATGRAFVIEGDEYDSAFFDKTAKFLKYLPDIAVINNIEFDHADIYRGSRCRAAGVPPAGQSGAAAG